MMITMRLSRINAALTAACLALPRLALAATTPAAPSAGGLGAAASKFQTAAGIAYGSGTSDLESIVGGLIQTFLGLLGVIFLVLAIYGGFLWMTARGDEKQVDKAKATIQAAVIGLAIVLGAYAITGFVINALVGATTGGGSSAAINVNG